MCLSILVNAPDSWERGPAKRAVSRAKQLISRRRAYRDNKIEAKKGIHR